MAINNTSNVKGGVTTINATVVVPSLTAEERQELTRVLEDGVPNVVEEKATPKGTISLERVYTPPVITSPPEVIVTQTASQEPPVVLQEVAEASTEEPLVSAFDLAAALAILIGKPEEFKQAIDEALSILDEDTRQAMREYMDRSPEEATDVLPDIVREIMTDPAMLIQAATKGESIKDLVVNKVIERIMMAALAGKKRVVKTLEEALVSDENFLEYVLDETNDFSSFTASTQSTFDIVRKMKSREEGTRENIAPSPWSSLLYASLKIARITRNASLQFCS